MSTTDLPRRPTGWGRLGPGTSPAALGLTLDTYISQAVEGATLRLADVGETWLRGLVRSPSTTSAPFPSLDPERVPIILGGAIIAETSLRILELEKVTVTGHDILDGVCLSLWHG